MRQPEKAPPVRSRSGGSRLPERVRSRLESEAGLDLGGVTVHRSPGLRGAYTRGTQIVVGPGHADGRTLEHEGRHVVQQLQGRVPVEGHVAGLPVNRSARLEREADRPLAPPQRAVPASPGPDVVQFAPGTIEHIADSCYVAAIINIFAAAPAYYNLLVPEANPVAASLQPLQDTLRRAANSVRQGKHVDGLWIAALIQQMHTAGLLVGGGAQDINEIFRRVVARLGHGGTESFLWNGGGTLQEQLAATFDGQDPTAVHVERGWLEDGQAPRNVLINGHIYTLRATIRRDVGQYTESHFISFVRMGGHFRSDDVGPSVLGVDHIADHAEPGEEPNSRVAVTYIYHRNGTGRADAARPVVDTDQMPRHVLRNAYQGRGNLLESGLGTLSKRLQRIGADAAQRQVQRELTVNSRYKNRGKLTAEETDELVEDLRRAGLYRAANQVILDYYTQVRPADARLGWAPPPRSNAKFKASSDRHPFDVRLPIPGRTPLKSELDMNRVLIPKFRGIHYRSEPESRFHDQSTVDEHVALDETGTSQLAGSVYARQDKDQVDEHGRRLAPWRDNPTERMMQDLHQKRQKDSSSPSAPVRFTMPPLAEDEARRATEKLRRKRVAREDSSSFPKGRTNQLEADQQQYVNAYSRYEAELRKRREPGLRQVSTTDSPYHAAMYAYGAKFTTQEQARRAAELRDKRRAAKEKAKTKRSGGVRKKRKMRPVADPKTMTGGRRVKGVVGKAYTFLLTPAELQQEDPFVIPEMQYRDQARIHAHQQHELETTFHDSTPASSLVGQMSIEPASKRARRYESESDDPSGQRMRESFSKSAATRLWNQAQKEARRRRMHLVPHGTLASITKHHASSSDASGGLQELVRQQQEDRAAVAFWSLRIRTAGPRGRDTYAEVARLVTAAGVADRVGTELRLLRLAVGESDFIWSVRLEELIAAVARVLNPLG